MRINTFGFAIIATVYSATTRCDTDADCLAYASTTCVHGVHAECQVVNGAGGGGGEKGCVCVHNGKRAGMCNDSF